MLLWEAIRCYAQPRQEDLAFPPKEMETMDSFEVVLTRLLAMFYSV